MALVTQFLFDNPVLMKEMRIRMRGARAYWILFGYLGFLATILLVQYWVWIAKVQSGSGGSEASRIGNDIYNYLIVTQIFLVLFITPAITSGSITIENEQRTMDMLTMTRLARWSIVGGKLLAAVTFTALLLISSLPLVSICFMLGSVDPAMVFSTYMMMLMGSFLIGAMGLMWSSIARTTTQAVMYTYGSLFVLFLGGTIPFGAFAVSNATGMAGGNPFTAIGAVLFGNDFLGIKGPEGLGFALCCVLLGFLFAAIAMARLETWPERKAGLLRGLTMLNVGVILLAIYHWWLEAWYHRGMQTVQTVAQPPIAALFITAFLLMAIVPTFATGELTAREAANFGQFLAWGWTPKGLKRGKIASGIPFLILLSLFTLLLYCSAFIVIGKAKDILASGSTAATSNTIVPNNKIAVGTFTAGTLTQPVMPITPPQNVIPAASAAKAGDFPQAAIVLLSSVLGFALLCIFLSVLCNHRWVAWVFASLFFVAILILPEIGHIPVYAGDSPQPTVQLYYLNPMQAIAQMADPINYYNNSMMSKGQLMFGTTPMWQGTTILWLVIGAIAFLLTFGIIATRKQQFKTIPFEDAVEAI